MMKKTPEERARMMRGFKRENTAPEVAVRRLAHQLGYRFRLHRKDLPGKPDIVFASRKKVILVHGCFWHSHGCALTRVPKDNQEYWLPKLERNRARDITNLRELQKAGWSCLVLWECEIRAGESKLRARLRRFLQ
jgi:DNA mismatch endonuclease (patch repair protein)